MQKDAIGKRVADHLWGDRHWACRLQRNRGRAAEGYRTENNERIRDQYGTVWGDDETLFQRGTGRFAREDGADGGSYAGIGVNVYLWRAALETIDFLPLAQADPFGGVIITDWYSPRTPRRALQAQRLHPRHRAPGGWRQGRGVPPDQRRERLAGRRGRPADRDQDRGQHPDPGARAAHRRLERQRLQVPEVRPFPIAPAPRYRASSEQDAMRSRSSDAVGCRVVQNARRPVGAVAADVPGYMTTARR